MEANKTILPSTTMATVNLVSCGQEVVSSQLCPDSELFSLPSCDVIKETVQIPRPAVFTANMDVFSDLSIFCKLTGYVPLPTKVLVKNKLPNIMHQVRALGNLFRKVRRTATISTTKTDYSLLDDKPLSEFFSPDFLQQWKNKKAVLLAQIEKHRDALKKLGAARKVCWKTEASVKKYQLIVDTQAAAIQHNPAEVKVRTAAMQKMQSILAKKQHLHEQTTSSFLDKYLLEISKKESVQELAKEIESEVVEVMENSIARLMQVNRQDMSAEKVTEHAQMIYKMTCRSYEFDQVMPEPCQRVWIGETTFHGSQMTRKAMLKLKG